MTPTAEQRSFLLAQKTELERLLQEVKDHPLMAPPLEARLREIDEKLAGIPEEVQPRGRKALFFSKGGVEGSYGIEADLGGDILAAYEKMFEAHAKHDQLAQSDRQRFRNMPQPKLLLTALPRGSVGFELVPKDVEDWVVNGVHAETLRNLTRAMADVTESDEKFTESLERIPAKVLKPLKDFLQVLVDRGTEVRMITEGLQEEVRLDLAHLLEGVRRLKETPEDVDEKDFYGTFQAITLESFHFEFTTDEGKTLRGLADEDAINYDKGVRLNKTFSGQVCMASIRVTTVRPLHGKPKVTYELLDVNKPREKEGA